MVTRPIRTGRALAPGLTLAALAVLSLASSAGTRFRYQITDLGTLGGFTSVALAINDVGQVVGSADIQDGSRHAYVWQDGKMTDLGTFETGTVSEAWDINNLGTVVGGPFVWRDKQIMLVGKNINEAFGINDAEQIAGQAYFPEAGHHACLFQDAELTDLGTFGGSTSLAWDINELGQVTGGAQTPEGPAHAFLWDDGTLTDLGTLGGVSSNGLGINDHGHVVGASRYTPESADPHAFLWDGQQMIDLDAGRFGYSEAWAINNDGQIVGSGLVGVEYRGFLHDPLYGFIDLQDALAANPGWTELRPKDINDAGQIVGWGRNPQGIARAFLLDPLPPIPAASAWTLAAAALALTTAGTILLRRNRLPARPRAVQ